MIQDTRRRDAGTFVGRQSELALLRTRLDEVRAGNPRLVLVEGTDGIGKTALLERVLAQASDVRILRADGVREERLLHYGVAQRLAQSAEAPLSDELAGLIAKSTPGPETFTVGARFLDLLGSLQRHGPVAVAVDDAQWADRASLLALLFAFRRLHADRVLAIIAIRDDSLRRLPEGLLKLFASAGGDTLRLSGLNATELQELAAGVVAEGLPLEVAKHLEEHTGGNPLHACALLEELPRDRLRRVTDAPLPSPRSFSLQVLSRLARCSRTSRRLLTAASILGLQCPLTLAQRLAGIEDPLAALEGAMAVRLLEEREIESGHGIAFPHAMIRAAIYQDIGPARRATLHLRAAELIADEARSLQHRIAAAVTEDEPLAAELADYARREAGRGAWALAAEAMLRAVRLGPAVERQEQRLLEGVDFLLMAGDVSRAATFTEEISLCADGPSRRYVLGRLAFHAGRPIEGHALLLAAWDACDPSLDGALATRIATEVALVLVQRARGPELVIWARRAMTAAAGAPVARSPWAHLAYGLAYVGRAHEGLLEIPSLPEAPFDVQAEDVPALYARGLLRFMTDDLSRARADFSAVEPAAMRSGPFMFRLASLSSLADVEYRLGAWDDAIAHAELGASCGEDADQAWALTWLHATAAAPLAGRGEWEAAKAHSEAAACVARLVNDETAVGDVAVARMRIASARGDHKAVVDASMPLVRMQRREGIDEPGARWPWYEFYADALLSLGRLREAEAVLTWFEEPAVARGLRSAMANAARVRGNLEAARKHNDAANAAFLAGLEHSRAVSFPFDRARLEAAYGGFLRRLGRRAAAVVQLKAARDRFLELGARPYVQRCHRELEVSGVAPADRRDLRPATLTPQEVTVASYVAQGLSNREVATTLVVSLNTIEYHLKNIYSKLALTSRSQLVLWVREQASL
jgi:DNA-binding CsgD family transcriptional regulator